MYPPRLKVVTFVSVHIIIFFSSPDILMQSRDSGISEIWRFRNHNSRDSRMKILENSGDFLYREFPNGNCSRQYARTRHIVSSVRTSATDAWNWMAFPFVYTIFYYIWYSTSIVVHTLTEDIGFSLGTDILRHVHNPDHFIRSVSRCQINICDVNGFNRQNHHVIFRINCIIFMSDVHSDVYYGLQEYYSITRTTVV